MPIETDEFTAISENSVAELFASSARAAPRAPFVAFRSSTKEIGKPFDEISYGDFLQQVEAIREQYRRLNLGVGKRVALLIGNDWIFHIHFLALNGLGVSIVPLNPDARPVESVYLVEHSECDLLVCQRAHRSTADQILDLMETRIPVFDAHAAQFDGAFRLPGTHTSITDPVDGRNQEAAVLYTSGTTGRPKGCVLTNEYFLRVGAVYASWGGLLALREGAERLLNPLPLFHMNHLATTTTAIIARRGCNVMVPRFSASTWWADCRDSGATLIHYLGVMPAILLNRPPESGESLHSIRAGVGAGVDPEHHVLFEERFGFPLLELWGMTEVGAGFIDNHEPRQRHTRAFGRPVPGILRARVVDNGMAEVPVGTEGELLVQSDTEDPRFGFFSSYLKNDRATAEAWSDDWFRTGDVVCQDTSGMLYFVDRKKNIIRRSGENISAAEVEMCLQAHEAVAQVAVIAIDDELREEEVFACVVLRGGFQKNADTAKSIFDHCYVRLSYFKAPGFICFLNSIPTTSTQKIQKTLLFSDEQDPRALPMTHDLRQFKRYEK